jgi:hypothetical protein
MFVVQFASTLGLDTTTVNDAGSTRIVVIVTFLLIAFGIGLGVLNVWFWKKTKPDPEALGPLVEMSSRKFVDLEPIEQRHRLDQLRPSLVSAPKIEALPVMQPPISLEDEKQDIDTEIVADVEIEENSDQSSDHIEDPLLSNTPSSASSRSNSRSTSRSTNDIDWDDDEWPDVDDWSLPGEKVQQQELFDQDLEDELEEVVAPEVHKEQPKKGPVSIDPLLGFS